MKHIINILILIFLTSCNSFQKKPAEELIKALEMYPDIKYLETNINILKVNKTYYCDLTDSRIKCMNEQQVRKRFNCTKEELDKLFELVRKSGAFAVEKNNSGQVLFAKGDFMNNFSGLMYSPTEIDLTIKNNYFVNFFISNIEKENESWYRVE